MEITPIITLRRALHTCPEISGQEQNEIGNQFSFALLELFPEFLPIRLLFAHIGSFLR